KLCRWPTTSASSPTRSEDRRGNQRPSLSCGSHQPRQTSVLVYSHLDVAVLRRDNTLGDGERSLGWYLEEGGHEDRFLIRGVVRGMDVAAPRVDEHGACRVVPLCTVISRNVYQLTLHDVDEDGS